MFREATVEVVRTPDATVVKVGNIKKSETTFSSRSTSAFLETVLGSQKMFHHLSRDEIRCPDRRRDAPVPTASLVYQAAHTAFAQHVPLSLSPVILWYMIIHEIAVYVQQNREACAHYFTSSPEEKKMIEVRDDSLIYGEANDWGRSINLIRSHLQELIEPNVLATFLPEFSMMTEEEATAILVSFMDTISEYYKYQWRTLCGIPEIRLEGPVGDWELLLSSARKLQSMFGEGDLSLYFEQLLPVLDTIRGTVATGEGDAHFWSSIYKVDSVSGGPNINGWLTAFTAYTPTPEGFQLRKRFDWDDHSGLTTENFPSHVSRVHFDWDYAGTVIPMSFVAGVFGVEQDTFLTPKLGFGVVERLQNE